MSPARHIAATILLSIPCARPAPAGELVWLEGESGSANFPAGTEGWGRSRFLSGEKWLHVSIDVADVEKKIPAGGIEIDYMFRIAETGRYDVWSRIGFEFDRSPFAW